MRNQNFGTVFLIPVPLAEGKFIDILPPLTLHVIQSIHVFLVEDIRSARRFLRAAGYAGDFRDITFHLLNEHTAPEEINGMLGAVLKGADTGVISQAGTPCVADPGASVVITAHALHIKVVPLVGPSSLLLALMASGFNGQNFAFHGYLPIKNPARINKIREIETDACRKDQTQIFIETPYRNIQLLQDLLQTCKDQTMLCIAANLTLPGETIVSQPVSWWKMNIPELHKIPCVFLLYR